MGFCSADRSFDRRLKSGARIIVTDHNCEAMRTRYYRPGIPTCPIVRSYLPEFVGSNKCTHCLEEALYTRLCGVSPQPTAHGKKVFRLGKNILLNKFKSLNLTPIDYLDVLNRYEGGKRKRYVFALDNVLNGRSSLKRDSRITVFTKKEKLAPLKPARTIQARQPEYNIRLARYTIPLERLVYGMNCPAKYGKAQMFSAGCDDFQRAEQIIRHWNQFIDPVCLQLDYSRFDKNVRRYQLAAEHDLYCKAYGEDGFLKNLLSLQLVNKGSNREGTVKYTVEGTRASGDMNTLMGNCIINACMILGCIAENKLNVRFLICGDDALVFCENRDLDRVKSALLRDINDMGHVLKVEGVAYVPQQIKFCSSNPLCRDDGKWFMYRDFRKVLGGYGQTHKHHQNIGGLSVLKTMAYADLLTQNGCPIVCAHYKSIIDNLDKFRLSRALFLDDDFRGWMRRSGLGSMSSKDCLSFLRSQEISYRLPSRHMRAQYELAFDISPVEQELLENHMEFSRPDYDRWCIEQAPCYGWPLDRCNCRKLGAS
uniref:RNA-directed RNA polymerase n=1 Tax=Tombus-like chagrupourvirus TaxID=2784749 RepID=A0A7S7BVP8_9TOMB|nr:RNA-dependent RNA polymerase [Tombus-like chagrupourvirus]